MSLPILLVAAVLAGGAPAPAPADPLLSQHHPVTASSTAGCCRAANAVDGLSGTRWASAAGAGTQWLAVDLGAIYDVTRVRLEWDASCARSYEIWAALDGMTWTVVYRTTTGDGGVDDLTLDRLGRSIRVVATERCRTGAGKGYSLREFQVYGHRPWDLPFPAAPRNVQATEVRCTSVRLTWTPGPGGVPDHYVVQSGGVDLAIVAGDTNSAVITGLQMGTSYTFTVLAVDAEGDRSAPSNAAVARTGICESEPPTVPTGLAVTGVDGDCATLAWQPSTDNVGVVGYHVFVDGLPAATTPGNRVTATVCGLAPGGHTAAVSAFDAAGAESARSNAISFTLPLRSRGRGQAGPI
jgi:hypothetical protein